MLIKNTDGAYCKIKETKVSGLKAYITLVIYSSVPQTTKDSMGNIHRVFSFYLRDLNSTELVRLSHNNYWIDRNNNYNNDSNNIDINMHREIILEVDITNNNQSEMQEGRWVRRCNIILIDHTTGSEEAWVSENLELISKEIELPELIKFSIYKNSDNYLEINFKYKYESQEDFSYINSNIYYDLAIKTTYSNETIEHREFYSSQNNPINNTDISYISENKYTEPVIICMQIKNLKGETISIKNKFFNPLINSNRVTIKDNDLLPIKSISIKTNDIVPVKLITTK